RPIYIEDEKKTAERAADQFHARMNAEQYEAMYEATGEQFKTANSKEATVSAMKATRARMGKIVGVTEHWVNYVTGDPIPVRAIYNVKCEKGEFSEWFAFAMSKKGEALLVNYQNFTGYSPPPNTNSK
ncbi:MAG: hypothetical protein ACJ741_14475, partial [Pyrinomonadaceae bacterium]